MTLSNQCCAICFSVEWQKQATSVTYLKNDNWRNYWRTHFPRWLRTSRKLRHKLNNNYQRWWKRRQFKIRANELEAFFKVNYFLMKQVTALMTKPPIFRKRTGAFSWIPAIKMILLLVMMDVTEIFQGGEDCWGDTDKKPFGTAIVSKRETSLSCSESKQSKKQMAKSIDPSTGSRQKTLNKRKFLLDQILISALFTVRKKVRPT